MQVSFGSQPIMPKSSFQGAQAAEESKNREGLLDKLRRDSYNEVMAHEMAHQSKAGSYGGPIVLEYGKHGIVKGGHVGISMPGLDRNNPENSLKAYQMIRDAALAPHKPSSADFSVASQALALMGQAQVLMGRKPD